MGDYNIGQFLDDLSLGRAVPKHVQEALQRPNPLAKHRIPDRMPTTDDILRARPDAPSLLWGDRWFLLDASIPHMFFLGMTRSGKSNLIQVVLSCIAPEISPSGNKRIFIFATKEDSQQTLESLGVPYTCIDISNPDSPGWDIARDYNFQQADQLAADLLPYDAKGDRVWIDGARAILAGVAKSLMYCQGQNWRISDLLNPFAETKDDLIKLLARCPGNQIAIEQVLKSASEKTEAGFRIQIVASLSGLVPFAAHCQSAKHLFSIRDFLHKGMVALVQPKLDELELTKRIIQAMFRRLTSILNSLPDARGKHAGRKAFVFLDEMQYMGLLEGVEDFTSFAAGRGGVLVASVQTIDMLYSIYGRERAEAMLGNFGNTTILKVRTEASAQWAVKQCGTVEQLERNESRTQATQGISLSESDRFITRTRITTSDVLGLDLADPHTGVFAYFLPPKFRDIAKVVVPPSLIDTLYPQGKEPPPHREKTVEEYILKPWTPEEKARFVLGLSPDDTVYRTAVMKAHADVIYDAWSYGINMIRPTRVSGTEPEIPAVRREILISGEVQTARPSLFDVLKDLTPGEKILPESPSEKDLEVDQSVQTDRRSLFDILKDLTPGEKILPESPSEKDLEVDQSVQTDRRSLFDILKDLQS